MVVRNYPCRRNNMSKVKCNKMSSMQSGRIMPLFASVLLMTVGCFTNVQAKPKKPSTDYVIYGSTNADLSPINDYIRMLYDNNIYLTIPDLSVTEKDDYDWIYTKIGEDIWLTYVWYRDGSKDRLVIELPVTFKQKDLAFVTLMMSMLSIEKDPAEEYLDELKDSVHEEWSTIYVEDNVVTYHETEYTCTVMVERVFDEKDDPETNGWFSTLKNTVTDESAFDEKDDLQEESGADGWFSTLKNQDDLTESIKRTIQRRLQEYWNVSLEDFSLVLHDNKEVTTSQIHLKWDVENSIEKTKQMLEMYSDDMAATIQEKYPDLKFDELYIFWVVPYINETWNSAKYKYESRSGKIYHIDSLGLLYGKD